ncbi:MAG: hypothetical protein IJT79_08115 [Ruminococcus sp.]|nr:hypothetical protein [Ruminococcus sp.]
MNKKLADILFVSGICLIIVGLLAGVIIGFITGEKFNLVPAITIWLLSIVIGTGLVSVSGSVNKVNAQKDDDEETLQQIIEKIKNDN